jgi:hypothetical protein
MYPLWAPSIQQSHVEASQRQGIAGLFSAETRGLPGGRAAAPGRNNRAMPDLDPAPVLDALARDPRLRVFLGDKGIETIPAKHSRRLLLLDRIAQAFEPGLRYPERQVNDFLGMLHPDYAALRRYLVDEEFLSRSHGEYWRTGGTVSPSTADRPPA